MSRTQLTWRSGLGLLAVGLLFDLAGIPVTGATSNRQRSQITAVRIAAVKQRLRVAAAVSMELEPLADASGSEKILRESHVRRYSAARPWASLSGGGSCDSFVADWPTETDAPALRALLADRDPKLRGLALEALATLHLPEDLPRIARLLADKSPAAPYAQRNGRVGFTPADFSASPEASSQMYSWYPATVGTYAWRALYIITGAPVDAKTFGQWWKVNRSYKQRLWYWNQRIRRAIFSVERGVREELQPATEVSADEEKRLDDSIEALTETRLEQLRKRLATEATLLPPEAAAKILLLATDCENGRDHPYFESTPRISLSALRLLELLDGKRLWPDVDWAKDEGHYNQLVHQIMLASPPAFGPEHVTRLQAIFARRRGQMWWSAEGAMFVGISRLLPAAQGNFNTATREGYLRAAIEGRGDLSALNMAAAELVRVALPDHWEYLKTALFSQPRGSGYPDLAQTIMRALGECPITAAKRDALLDLLKEPRIKPLLTQADERYRYYLGWTIRDHLAQDTTAPQTVFSSDSGNSLDALPGIIASLTSRAKDRPPVETCR